MVRRALLAAALLARASAFADGKLPEEPLDAAAPEIRVTHVPVAWAPADEPLELTVEVTNPHLAARVSLHYRRRGDEAWKELPFQRAPSGWTVTVPAADLAPGAVEYWIGSHTVAAPTAPERAHFASAALPHPFVVVGDEEARWRKELLAAERGHRSRFRLRAEVADFGTRALPDGTPQADYYWRTEGDFSYRFLGWIYAIRLGLGLLRGETYHVDESGARVPVARVGLSYGFAEVRFRLGRWVRLDVSATLGAGPTSFDGGGGAQLTIGDDPGTHFAIGFDRVTTVGGSAWIRLAWNTVPKVPMALTIETTDLPSMNGLSGRVYFSAQVRPARHLVVDALLGYSTRDNGVGGPTAGLAGSLEF